MIPSVVANQIKYGIEDFLRSSYPVTTGGMSDLLDCLFADGHSFKGPYLSIALPFQASYRDDTHFHSVSLVFQPYLHQELSFARLAIERPKSTVIATGTGSGKTECFLYPILEHCFKTRDKQGIKAIIVYPMNALATDQARRIARTVAGSPDLAGKIRVGLFVGEAEKEPKVVMDPDMVITDKMTLRQSPPDILLTNYKMLDYLLLRPGDADLWKHNSPDSLKFLVVDELHTFDGAQGTDLACLIRRLKKRLDTPKDYLCCIGTSATLGGEGDATELIRFSRSIFGEPFDENSVIREFRLSTEEYLRNSNTEEQFFVIPQGSEKSRLEYSSYQSFHEYLQGVYSVWFEDESNFDVLDNKWRVELGSKLQAHYGFRSLLKIASQKPVNVNDLISEYSKRLGTSDIELDFQRSLVDSMVALISHARSSSDGPFLNVRLQLWLRELKRMVAEVGAQPHLRFSDDLTAEQRRNHLPVVYCDDCGATAWAGLWLPEKNILQSELRTFYDAFFSNDRNVRFVYPSADIDEELGTAAEHVLICSDCLKLHGYKLDGSTSECSDCGSENLVSAYMPNIVVRGKGTIGTSRECPVCFTTREVRLVGAQAANLSGIVVSNLFTSPWNRDKRLIAFSDSVQDASHRAGFIRTRSASITLRTALQKFIDSLDESLTLSSVPDAFLSSLLKEESETHVIGRFLPGDLEFHEDFDLIKQGSPLPENSSLKEAFLARLKWDILSEFGARARIGRTLEKSGASVAQIDSDALRGAIHDLYEMYINEDGGFRQLGETSVQGFVTGLLMHLKLNGGICHDLLSSYVNHFGNAWAMKPKWWWIKSGIFSFPPRFFTDGRIDKSPFERAIGNTNQRSWTFRWLQTCFMEIGATLVQQPDALYELAFKSLLKYGILNEQQVGQARVWGLNPDVLVITNIVQPLRCNRCRHELSVGQNELSFWHSTPCLREVCHGKYGREQLDERDYYRTLFKRGDSLRIVPAEHTGLLERESRDRVEESFIHGTEPWDPNILSATPTLEMGIDIGDLSSVLLCSVPPSQANYLQRIGRAGRRDGNSLAVTVANGKPHDLFFFASPEEMISGVVQSPGVFLNASAILERQLTAYCFDRWVASGITDVEFPSKLESVLNNIDRKQQDAFPYTWIKFIQDNRMDLISSFLDLFKSDITSDTETQLREFFERDRSFVGSLEWRVLDGLESLAKERESTRIALRALDKKIRDKKKSPVRDQNFEEELEELKNEKSGLQEIVARLNKKHTLEFFTDEGFIPNYAFPEAGVTLKSVIYRKRERQKVGDDGNSYQYWTYNYERPSSAAISELAPANFFYAEGRRVRIDQINMKVSEIEDWRLCPNCSYCQRLFGGDSSTSCPFCGDGMWPDVKQKKQMVRLRQVLATSSAARSGIGDEKEERSPAYFNKQLLVNFDKQYLKDAFSIEDDSFPFGFEYSSKTTFREINSGQKDASGEQIYIAGIQSPRKGFYVCKECGKVQSKKTGEQKHASSCPARNQSSEKNLIELLYLYREFTSEAVRILLPTTTFSDSDRLIHSFIAALQMGIRDWYGGKVDHLKTTIYEEPIDSSKFRKRYVVLYDTVPGGTGYLKELMSSEEKIISLLTGALEKLKSCTCNQSDFSPDARIRDGCYRCLFAYRNSYDMPSTSRESAKETLGEIVSRAHLLKRIDTLSSVKVHGLLDSELEQRFLEALGELKLSDRAVSLTKEVVNGKPGFLFRIGDQSYNIEPQVSLGPEQGVSVVSKADYVFYPLRHSHKIKPIVVFLDGLEFHKERIGLDLRQRVALASSGRYSVWSLTWDDVQSRFNLEDDYYHDYLTLCTNSNVASRRKAFATAYDIPEFIDFYKLDSFRLFVEFLKKPSIEQWRKHALLVAMGFFDEKYISSEGQKKWIEAHAAVMPPELGERFDPRVETRVLGAAAQTDEYGNNRFQIFASAPQATLGKNADGLYISASFDSSMNRQEKEFRREWAGMLRLFNLLHFAPTCFFKTISDDSLFTAELLKQAGGSIAESPIADIEADEWQSAIDYADPTVHKLLIKAKEADFSVPEVGFDIVGEDGSVLVTAELAWITEKLAVVLEAPTDSIRERLKAEGWNYMSPLDAEIEISARSSKV